MKPVKREQTTPSRFSLATVALAAVLAASGVFCSCTKMEVELLPSHSRQITLSASVGTIGVETEAQSRTQTKAPAVDTDEQTLYFARADESSNGVYGNYATTVFSGSRPAGTGQQKLTFNPTQYYRTDKLKTKLTGWYPIGTYNSTARTVTWTINGQHDIMTAPRVEGSTLSHISSMTFTHRLTQLRFHPYAESQATADAWGKITKIEVLNQQNTVIYTLADDALGTVTFSGNATNTFSAGVAIAGSAMSVSTVANKVANAKQMGDAVMIVPQSLSSYVLTLRITTEKQTRDVTLTGALKAGTPYRLYLCFKALDITIQASVVNDWVEVTTDDQLGYVRVGDLSDGGIVYYIDPANPERYKVFSLDQAQKTWAAANTYVLNSAGQSGTDGKANVAAMKSYATDKGLTFSTAFPAASFCEAKNIGSITGWYLPAIDELIALYTAYHADNTLKNALVGVGTDFGSNPFWSSTEKSTSEACFVHFSTGSSSITVKGSNLFVRCIRNIN